MPVIARGQITIREATDTYAVYQSIDKAAISCDHTGKVLSTVSVNSVISVRSGDTLVTDFTIGAITKPVGFYSVTVNQTTKTISYLISGGDTTLADTGVISIGVLINGQTYTASFNWFKVKVGSPGKPGVDASLLDWVAEWNSGKTVIDGQSIITPKIFAGIKNSNGTITGMAIGKFALSTRNASGIIGAETVNGIYGFADGKKTFAIDATGNVQLGNGNEYIKYNAATGKVEFGSSVALAWIGATYINSNGVFTGTLSANTVNVLNINASQITAGILNAARIDVNSLKASLLTASNIEALTLNVTKGKIGGWSLDIDSIYRGTKNNIAGGFTSASGGVSIGSTGIRGYKWRLESTGAGALAGGNISWDAAGNVVFGASVSLNWTNAANAALNSAKSYADTKKTEAINSAASDATVKANAAKELAQAMAFGRMMYRDPTFWNGMNGIAIYNNYGNGNVTLTRKQDSNAPNDSKFILEIRTVGAASPGNGGFHFSTNCSYRKIFITRLIAKIPLGRNLCFATNSTGTGGQNKWLTPVAGTGDWTEYICKIVCGTSNFSSTNFFYVDGVQGSVEIPFLWHVAYATVFDVTSTEKYTTTIDSNGIYTSTLNANQINAGTISADRIAAGSITAGKLDVASVRADIINVGYINGLSCTFTKGRIGGWNIGAGNITIGSIGSVGATPIQLQSVSTGSGVWYNGAYKPYGLSMLWYQNANAGHFVFGQIATSGTAVKAGFIGLQMMSYDNLEYFCLSANSQRSGSKEVYNRIAGWAFDSASISKNNVSLGSDGSITNLTKWKLNSDGSGLLANGAITWNAAGVVTFSPAVSLNWTDAAKNAANSGKLYVRGTGYNHYASRIVALNGVTIFESSIRGLVLSILNRSNLSVVSHTTYDVYGSDANCNTLATVLNGLDSTKIVILTSYDAIRINGALNTAIQRCGGSDLLITDARIPYALVGIPGIGKNNGLTSVFGLGATDPFAELSTTIINGIPQGVCAETRNMTVIY